jgi:CheY-like chemotaxis protein
LAKVEEGPLRATNGEMRSTQCEPCSTETFVARLSIPAAEEVPVLFVDDNADALQLFERYLMGTRYRFVGAQDAGQAMAAAAAFKPCAILLDVMMPKQDGWALLHYLREHPDTSNLPVIVATILPQEQLALTLGAAGFLRKPISRMDLLTALEPLWNLRQSARAPC